MDYTRSEAPVTLKLSYGRMRNFADVDGPPEKPMFFYLGDKNPVGPKTWKTRQLLFVKPDYLVVFDRVSGKVAHRWNLHAVTDAMKRDGSLVRARGRFDLDLLAFVQHPAEFKFEQGELVPQLGKAGEGQPHPPELHAIVQPDRRRVTAWRYLRRSAGATCASRTSARAA